MGKTKVSENNQCAAQSPETQKEKIIIIKDTGNRKLFIFIAAMLALAVTGYAMTVENFSDYSPLDYLNYHWCDYYVNNNINKAPTVYNETSDFPSWSVEYPYRAIFMAAERLSASDKIASDNSEPYILYCVYSKVPATDLFEFTSPGGFSFTVGRIRAAIAENNVGSDKDFRILYVRGKKADFMTGDSSILGLTRVSEWSSLYPKYLDGQGLGTQGIYNNKWYFDFDFYYDCAAEHQQGAQNLKINGITNISGVSYKYILNCTEHVGWTANGSGGGSSIGNSGGTGSGGNKWGNGQYGGGIDWGNSGDPSISSGSGGYSSSRPDWSHSYPEYSTSDDWKKPSTGGTNSGSYSWENDSNVPSYNFDIPVPTFKGQGDGDTGYSGGTIPNFKDIPMNNIDFHFTIPTMPHKDKITFIGNPDQLYFENKWPPKYPG